MNIDEYMLKHFPGLALEPPLFYNWNVGIRFELGDPQEDNEKNYMDRVLERSLTLLKTLHQNNDEIFIVSYFDEPKTKRYKKLNVFYPFIRNKKVKYQMRHTALPFQEQDEDEDDGWETHRLLLKCKVNDINLPNIIRAFFYKDSMPRLYFINIKRETIFSIYDSRGCDLVSTKKENIEDVYHTFNDWILDWDRSQIEQLFN